MKNGLITLMLLIITAAAFSQTDIKGNITDERNEPLEAASIYLNNTTLGTVSDEKGNFSLKVKKGNYDLVISYIGYKTKYIKINTNKKIDFLNIQLILDDNVLDEVVLKKTDYNLKWKNNLYTFKKLFLGRTMLASKCKILNPKVLHFNFDKKTATLSAVAEEPLKIKHDGLGYLISYDLVSFSLKGNSLKYVGYTKFEDLKGGKSKQKRWKKNRLKAYNGSVMHFVRSLRTKKLKKEGFVVNQFRRFINNEKPSKLKIRAARELVKKHRIVGSNKKTLSSSKELDDAIAFLQSSKLLKFKDSLYKKNVSYRNMIAKSKGEILLYFSDFLNITYLNEVEEVNYPSKDHENPSNGQISNITLLGKYAVLDPSGAIVNPFNVFVEGYWGFESFANMLPTDYQPIKD